MAKATGIQYISLDDIVYEPDEKSTWGKRKRPSEEREEMFGRILKQESWIIEDVGREL